MSNDSAHRFCKAALVDAPTTDLVVHAETKAALFKPFQWPNASVIKVRFLGGDASLCEKVRTVAERWTAPGMANLRFSWIASGNAHIRIAFQQGAGSWSYMGTSCRQITNQDEPTMNYGWLDASSSDEEIRSVVLHEFGHALGLIHEHQNPLEAIEWDEEAVIRDLSGPPNNWSEQQIRHNVLDRYRLVDVTATPVDRTSIMMYPIPASWTRGTFTAGFNSDLSPIDRQLIRTCYP